jgi:hypothetical protein
MDAAGARYRAAKREARRLEKEGKTPKAIAAQLQRDIAQIRKWLKPS